MYAENSQPTVSHITKQNLPTLHDYRINKLKTVLNNFFFYKKLTVLPL